MYLFNHRGNLRNDGEGKGGRSWSNQSERFYIKIDLLQIFLHFTSKEKPSLLVYHFKNDEDLKILYQMYSAMTSVCKHLKDELLTWHHPNTQIVRVRTSKKNW